MWRGLQYLKQAAKPALARTHHTIQPSSKTPYQPRFEAWKACKNMATAGRMTNSGGWIGTEDRETETEKYRDEDLLDVSDSFPRLTYPRVT